MAGKPIKGLALSELFYREAVEPILETHFPGLAYSAARINSGSDVMGFDDAISTDHYWGPILEIYLSSEDYSNYRDKLDAAMREELPREVAGFSTNFETRPDGSMKPCDSGPIEHRICFFCSDTFVYSYRPFNPLKELTALDWLMLTQQRLRCIRAGKVFYDGLSELERIREKLHYYPRDVWLHLMAAQWCRIGQEQAFPGRCQHVGDELGSRLIATRLVQDLMQLCFFIEREYAPYSKWFGAAFAQLKCAQELRPLFQGVITGPTWQEREDSLVQAYQTVGKLQNSLAIIEPLPVETGNYFNRPYQVINTNFAKALYEAIKDEEVKKLPIGVGAVDQFLNSTDVLDNNSRRERLVGLYSGD